MPGQSIAGLFERLGLPYLLIMGTATALLGLLLRDLEVRRRNENALKEREARLRAIAGAVPDILFVLDENGRYVEVMTRDERQLYRDAKDVVGQNIRTLLPEPAASKIMAAIRKRSTRARRSAPRMRWTCREADVSSKGASRPSRARRGRAWWS